MNDINEIAEPAKFALRNAVDLALMRHEVATGQTMDRLTNCAIIEELRKIIAELDRDGRLTS